MALAPQALSQLDERPGGEAPGPAEPLRPAGGERPTTPLTPAPSRKLSPPAGCARTSDRMCAGIDGGEPPGTSCGLCGERGKPSASADAPPALVGLTGLRADAAPLGGGRAPRPADGGLRGVRPVMPREKVAGAAATAAASAAELSAEVRCCLALLGGAPGEREPEERRSTEGGTVEPQARRDDGAGAGGEDRAPKPPAVDAGESGRGCCG